MTRTKVSIVVLISGNGSNLQALIDAQPGYAYEIAAVISNNPDAYGLLRAKEAKIPTAVIPHQAFETRQDFDDALQTTILKYNPSLVLLAGFMRKLGRDIVTRFADRLINIHPSLLPKYPGLNTHKKVLTNGDKTHGVSIHVVTEELDTGPLISQASLDVLPNEPEISLEQRIHILEHRLYPLTAHLLASQTLTIKQSQVLFRNTPLTKCLSLEELTQAL